MKKNSYSYDDLITCGNGELFGPGNAKLPLPPMLMFDRKFFRLGYGGGYYDKSITKLKKHFQKKKSFLLQLDFRIVNKNLIKYLMKIMI